VYAISSNTGVKGVLIDDDRRQVIRYISHRRQAWFFPCPLPPHRHARVRFLCRGP
jgi:hypothetical protein